MLIAGESRRTGCMGVLRWGARHVLAWQVSRGSPYKATRHHEQHEEGQCSHHSRTLLGACQAGTSVARVGQCVAPAMTSEPQRVSCVRSMCLLQTCAALRIPRPDVGQKPACMCLTRSMHAAHACRASQACKPAHWALMGGTPAGAPQQHAPCGTELQGAKQADIFVPGVMGVALGVLACTRYP